MRSAADVQRLGLTLIEAAHGAATVAAFQRVAFAALAPIGFEVVLLELKSPRADVYAGGLDEGILAFARGRWGVYAEELSAVARAAERDGVAIDTEVLGAGRERLAYYQEVVRPHGGTSSLFVHLAVGGRTRGSLMLGRAGTAFRADEAGALRALQAPLSVGLGAVLEAEAPLLVERSLEGHGTALQPPLDGVATAREREVLELVQRGLTNAEVAGVLGTSPNTVRNQVASLFAKLGATTRAELVGLTLAPGGWGALDQGSASRALMARSRPLRAPAPNPRERTARASGPPGGPAPKARSPFVP